MCGEHSFCAITVRPMRGSSPRVRGTQSTRKHRPNVTGIIPACAGNTVSGFPHAFVGRDHPRVCGEHLRGLNRFMA
ncbi:hypothetical protein BIFANG_03349 [Bifidobacterium angulatum DSM 20098 = JCM 7096]|nr:hypothetical protein BIFANG_03349 [Bifidobacterium angulatum DSM 20098 = JCM 7096]